MSPRFREKKRLREQRILGIQTGIPEYIPPEPSELRGFKLKFYNLADEKIGELGSDVKEGKVLNTNFELLTSGCGAFSFVIDDNPGFDITYRTRVDIHPYFQDIPWFTGFVQTLPQPGKKRPYEYTGFGFFDQLNWITVTKSYETQDVSLIVKDIIQNIVAPNTQIVYNAAKIETTGYTVDEIDFYLAFAKDAIQSLADMATGYEFGVDNSREFYFRAIDTDVHYSYWVGKHFQDIEINKNPFTVRNRLYIKVGLIQGEGYGYIKEGSNCIGYEEDTTSISTYGLREEIVTAPDVLNIMDAREWAKQILAEMKDPEVRATIQNVLFDATKAKIDAKGKIRVTVFDGTEYTLFVDKVSYNISSAGILGQMELK
ncbi:MAG: hypothetical protein U9R03_00450 [Candidatus Aerophobetes bacterium]|nr:hypothetical protein [Candidatus Aerophobetes bacterium]